MENNKIAYAEVYEILDLMDKKYIDKIPGKLVKMFREEKNSQYKPIVDIEKPLYEQNLQRETKVLLAILYVNYWCEDEQEKDSLLKSFAENEKLKEQEVREKYNPDNIFNNKYNKDENKSEESMMIEYKQDSFLQKIWNKIKYLFKKNK